MDIKKLFSWGKPAQDNVLHTPYGDFNLAKEDDRKRLKHVVIAIQRTTDALSRKDIADWRRAWQMAINIETPSRIRLYDIYNDVAVDGHLTGCVGQRTGFVLAKSFKLVDSSGKEDEEAQHYFDQGWFKELCRLILESVMWGHSLIELGDVVTDGDGHPCYDRVRLVPRKHVIPEYGRVVINQGDDWQSGIDYHATPFADWLIEAGRPDDLGLYLKAALHTIPKKHVLAFWDTFSEIFGMPMRIAKTPSRDQKDINRLDAMLRNMGSALSMVAPIDTEIELIESTKGDAFNVYDQRVNRANSELSKLIIGQTMTIEDGSSLSQSQTHLQVFQNLVEQDADMLRDVINNQLLPRMVKHGFPVHGLRFDWDDSIDYTPEQQVAYETMIADRYEVDPAYFAEKYSMPVGERRQPTPLMSTDGGDDGEADKGEKKSKPQDDKNKKKEEEKQQQNAHPFFD